MKNYLMLAAAGLLITACADPYSRVQGSNAQYGAQHGGQYAHAQTYLNHDCSATNCASGYSVAHSAPYGGHAAHGAHSVGYPVAQNYDAPVAPHMGSYGSHAGPAVGAPLAAAAGLRGYQAPQRGYFYGELGAVSYDELDSPYGIQGRLGYQSAKIFGAELEGSFGVIDEDVNTIDPTIGAITGEVGVDYQIAAFALARVPVGNRVNLLGRVGYHKTELGGEGTGGGVTVDVSEDFDGIAYGSAIEYNLSPRSAVRLDATRYDTDSGSLDAISLGYQRKF